MNVFEEILSRLGSKVRVRSLFSDIAIEDMQKIINRITAIMDEKIQLKESEGEKRKEKQKILLEIQKTLKEHNFSITDFYDVDHSSSMKRKTSTREQYLFQYTTPSGDTVSWYGSGIGRLPKGFQQYLEKAGKKRMDCIVAEKS